MRRQLCRFTVASKLKHERLSSRGTTLDTAGNEIGRAHV